MEKEQKFWMRKREKLLLERMCGNIHWTLHLSMVEKKTPHVCWNMWKSCDFSAFERKNIWEEWKEECLRGTEKKAFNWQNGKTWKLISLTINFHVNISEKSAYLFTRREYFISISPSIYSALFLNGAEARSELHYCSSFLLPFSCTSSAQLSLRIIGKTFDAEKIEKYNRPEWLQRLKKNQLVWMENGLKEIFTEFHNHFNS